MAAATPPVHAEEDGGQITESAALAAARKSGSPVEVLSKRGETREVFAQPDGSLLAREHLQPVRTLKDGRWAAIDTDLRTERDGIHPEVSTVGLTFSPGGSGPMASMTRAGRTISLTWPAPLPAPRIEGDTAVYASVLPDVDLRLRADADGFTHVLVVRTPEAARNPELAELNLGLSAQGLKTTTDAEGNQTISDAATGGTVFQAKAPKMWDSATPQQKQRSASAPSAPPPASTSTSTSPSASPSKPAPVSAALAKAPGDASRVAPMKVEVGGGKLTLRPDRAMLTSPDTAFPVYIDPKYYAPKSSHNLMVASNGWHEYDFTGAMGMGRCPVDLPPAGAYCNGDHVKRLFYRIPTSAFIGKDIISAEFAINETWAPSCDGRSVHIYRTTGFGASSTWNSTKDNWADYLTYRDVAKGYNSTCPAGAVRFNVLSAVKDAAKKGWSNTTFGLKAGHEDDQYGWKKFSSNGYLQVNYNTAPPQPRASQMSFSPGGSCTAHQWGSPASINRAPMLYATDLTDPDGGGVEGEKLTAQFAVRWTDPATDEAKEWVPPGGAIIKNSASGSHKSSFSVQVPQTAIPQNVLIGWDVRVYDGRVWSPWASTGSPSQCYFVYNPTALPAPSISSTAYPELDPAQPEITPTNGVGRYGAFDLAFDTRVTKYAYAVNTTPSAGSAVAKPAGTVTIQAAPAHSGVNQLQVMAWDAFNNHSTAVYQFWVTEGSAPVAHWKMDDAAGATALADSASDPGFPATTGGTVTYQEPGAVGKAAGLPGTGYAATASGVVDTTKSFAVSAWARLDDKSHNRVVVSQEGTRGSAFVLYYSEYYDRWMFYMSDASVDDATLIRAIGTTSPAAGQWTHLVGVYDHVAKHIQLYVNGRLQATTAQPAAYTGAGPVQIGRFRWNGIYGESYYFKGAIDDVKMYDRIVTPDEANAMSTVKSQVTGLWHLNTGANGQTPDDAPVTARHPAALAGGATVTNQDGQYIVMASEGALGALDLPGGDGDYASVQAPVINTGESFTVALWALTPGFPENDRTVFALEGTGTSAIAVRYDAAKGHYVLDIASGDQANATTTTAGNVSYHQGAYGEWDHIAVVFDGFNSEITLYVNGLKEASADGTSVPYRQGVRVFSPISSLQLGRAKLNGSYPAGQNWLGQIDDVWVLRGAATEDQLGFLLDPTEKSDL